MRFLIPILLVLALAACTELTRPRGNPCERLAGDGGALASIDFAMDQAATEAWIISAFAVDRRALQVASLVLHPDITTINWAGSSDDYDAAVDAEGLRLVRISFRESPPTGEALIECLGPPEQYRAIFTPSQVRNDLHVELWYPSQGIVAQIFQASRTLTPPAMSANTPLSSIAYLRDHDPAAMLRAAPIPADLPLERYPLQPWPGAWEQLNLQRDPTLEP